MYGSNSSGKKTYRQQNYGKGRMGPPGDCSVPFRPPHGRQGHYSSQNYNGVVSLQYKVDAMGDLLQQQSFVLADIREELQMISYNGGVRVLKRHQRGGDEQSERVACAGAAASFNEHAKALLDAIETGGEVDTNVKSALLAVLDNDELKTSILDKLNTSIRESFSRDVDALYVPLLEKSHTKLQELVAKILEEGFIVLEQTSVNFTNSVANVSSHLQRALSRHQKALYNATNNNGDFVTTLRNMLEEVMDKKLNKLREEILDVTSSQSGGDMDTERQFVGSTPLASPYSPLPSTNQHPFIIAELMKSMEIKKLIVEGDVNGGFERALCARDLSLVMVACKSVPPEGALDRPCRLSQAVLLSLVQQLTTDMLHDTHLKCRYLERAIINLDTGNPVTRLHLPLVFSEVHKHLGEFIQLYPSHIANERIKLIIKDIHDALISLGQLNSSSEKC